MVSSRVVEVVQQRAHDARARHPVRMPERDRPAVRVELLAERVDAELAAHREDLRGERLVQLHHVDVVDRHPGLLEHPAHGADRADAHDLRLDAGDRRRDDPRPRLQAELLRARVAHHDDRRGAVVERARVARRDLAAGLERGLERGELLERRLGPRAVVLRDAVPRRDLALEEAGLLRRDRALLRALREAVHVLARDVPALGDVLGRQAHRDVDVRDRRVVPEELRMELLAVLRVAVDLRDRLDAAGDERVALAGADRVERHADRLQRRRAEAVDGRPRHGRRQIGEQRGAAREVHALAVLREPAADHHVDDLLARQLRDLLQRRVDRERGEVVGARVDERPLARPADRRARGGDDDCVRQRRTLL